MREARRTDVPGTAKAPLVPGEVADSNSRDDAEHWTNVYQELIGFLAGVDAGSAALERYRRRLAFWRRRRQQLTEAMSANEPPGDDAPSSSSQPGPAAVDDSLE